jgi:hypothetical protein
VAASQECGDQIVHDVVLADDAAPDLGRQSVAGAHQFIEEFDVVPVVG